MEVRRVPVSHLWCHFCQYKVMVLSGNEVEKKNHVEIRIRCTQNESQYTVYIRGETSIAISMRVSQQQISDEKNEHCSLHSDVLETQSST